MMGAIRVVIDLLADGAPKEMRFQPSDRGTTNTTSVTVIVTVAGSEVSSP